MKRNIITGLLLVLLVFLGCSKPGSPVSPDTDDTPLDISQSMQDTNQQIVSYGTMNLETGEVEYPDRNSMPYIDITHLLGSNFVFTIDGFIPPDTLNITLSITNVTAITVYDVDIVFENLYGKTVLNPDSYMDIYQPWDLDPFIEFKKDFPDRAFGNGPDSQQLLLKYPSGSNPRVDFFIIAHLGGNTGGVYEISNWQVNGALTPSGGNAILSMMVLDHQNDITLAVADTTPITGGLTFFAQSANPDIWTADISNTQLAPVGSYSIPVMAKSPASPAYQTYNYFKLEVISGPTVFGEDKFLYNPGGLNHYASTEGHRNLLAEGKNFYLAFSSVFPSTMSGTTGNIHFTKSTDGGVTWSSVRNLTNEPAFGDVCGLPSMAKSGQNLYIAYERIHSLTTYSIDILKSTDDGVNWSVFQTLSTDRLSPSIVVDSRSVTDKIYLAFISRVSNNLNCEVGKYDGINPWVFNRVNDIAGTEARISQPDIAINDVTGKLMVSWSDKNVTPLADGSRILFDSSDNGTTWGTDVVVSDIWLDGSQEQGSRIAIDPSTGIPGVLYGVVTSSIFCQLKFTKATDLSSSGFLPSVLISQGSSEIGVGSLVIESSGRWMAAWHDSPEIFYDPNAVFSESFDGGASWTVYQLVNDRRFIQAFNPAMASNGADVCVAWMDNRNNYNEIFLDHGTH